MTRRPTVSLPKLEPTPDMFYRLVLACLILILAFYLCWRLLEKAERDRDSAREQMLAAKLKLAAVQRAVAT